MTDRDRPDTVDARADHARFAEWDGAYVLGALSPADRRAYQDHLASCPICSSSVADLAGMPGLLGELSHDEAVALLGDEPSRTPDLMPSLLHRMRRRRRARRWSFSGALVAAAAVAAVLALAVPAALSAQPGPTVTTALQQTTHASTSPLTAKVTLTTTKWGTSVGMVCKWNADSSWSPDSGDVSRYAYGLWVISAAGEAERVATWTAGPGDIVHATAATAVSVHDIARIELRAIDSGKVLLAAPVHPPST
jgi:hypothetical protein